MAASKGDCINNIVNQGIKTQEEKYYDVDYTMKLSLWQ